MAKFLPVIVWGLIGGLTSTLSTANPKTEQHREKLEQIRSRIEHKQQSLSQATDKKNDLQTTLMDVDTKISQATRRLHQIRKNYTQQQQQYDQLLIQVNAKQAELTTEKQHLAQLLRSAFQINRHGDLRLVLGQQNPAQLPRMMRYHQYFNQQRAHRIATVNAIIEQQQQARDQLTQQTQALERLQAQRTQELAELTRFKSQKQQVLANITTAIKNDANLLEQLQKDEKSLLGILQSLTRRPVAFPLDSDKNKRFSTLQGKLPWPSTGALVARFGQARGDQRWSGVMISAKQGNQVKAIASGRVAFADWLRGYGLLMIIDHGEDYMSLYGHTQSIYKDTGEWVEAGETIALVGDSGGQIQSGLYFEIRKAGKPLNPAKWCAGKSPPRHS